MINTISQVSKDELSVKGVNKQKVLLNYCKVRAKGKTVIELPKQAALLEA